LKKRAHHTAGEVAQRRFEHCRRAQNDRPNAVTAPNRSYPYFKAPLL